MSRPLTPELLAELAAGQVRRAEEVEHQRDYESIRADTWRDAAMAMAELIEWDDPEDSMAYHRYEAAKKLLDAAASLER